jgi:hypothetical protein
LRLDTAGLRAARPLGELGGGVPTEKPPLPPPLLPLLFRFGLAAGMLTLKLLLLLLLLLLLAPLGREFPCSATP